VRNRPAQYVKLLLIMPEKVYLDTCAFRYFGIAFANVGLEPEFRNRIVLSPLSTFEIFGQLASKVGGTVLQQVHAILNWTNPKHSEMLPMPGYLLRALWFGKAPADDGDAQDWQSRFYELLNTDSVSKIKDGALKYQKMMDDFKINMGQRFKDMLDDLRKKKYKTVDITAPWLEGIAKRIDADPKSMPSSSVVDSLSAYHEYEQSKVTTALKSRHYNALSRTNQNDIIDGEQLVYLADERLCLITGDTGIARRVKNSPQLSRIITATPAQLQDAKQASALIKSITH
jgi:hypothetical protein